MGIANSSPTTTKQRSITDNFNTNDIGNNNNNNNNNNRMLFFLHRTWAIIVTSSTKTRTLTRFNNNNRNNNTNNNKRKKRNWRNNNNINNNNTTNSELTSEYSQYSFCSCSQCQRNRDDDFSSISFSDFFETSSNMTPDNEHPSKKQNQYTFLEDVLNKDKQRPPIYNPEDYAIMLKKWGRKSSNINNAVGSGGGGGGGGGGCGNGGINGSGLISLYSSASTSDIDQMRTQNNTFRDYRNPMLISAGSEMTLRQFGTVSEMLTKLKSDLKLAYPSFVQEFVSDPLDGVTLLLDLLRAIQLNQSNTFIHGPPGSAATTGKIPPSLQRRTLLDELSCLQCLFNCCIRYTESLRKLISSSAGLFTVAVCIMSNVNKSRIIALQLLAKACDPTIGGHSAVSEAMSTLRLRFGEPVRFRFLVGMLTSHGGQKELIASGLSFLNKFLDTAGSNQKRLYIQAELDQAGFDINIIKTNIESGIGQEHIMREIQYWEKKNINIDYLTRRLEAFRKENTNMKEKIDILERNLKVLKDEKGILVCVEKNLKERCSELQSEIRSLKSGRSSKSSYIKKRQPSTPNEDEGISSSERSLTPDDDDDGPRKLLYETFSSINSEANQNHQTHKIQHHTNNSNINDDEETTIDEVIEELKNIINDAESEDLAKREQRKLEKEKRRIEEAQVASKLKIHIDADDYAIASESEIIPTDLHPLPPRKAKSLIHLFVPSEDYYTCPKELFFENETPCTSIEGSDSLLSSSKLPVNTPETVSATSVNIKKMTNTNNNTLQRTRRSLLVKKDMKRSESLRHIDKTSYNDHHHGPFSYTTTVNVCESQKNLDDRNKCKSLDRVDQGLESIVDIVVTNRSGYDQNIQLKNDSKTTTTTSLIKSVSNVYIQNNTRSNKFTNSIQSFEEKQKMFLPSSCDLPTDISYYFPRLKERKTPSFLIKRGHGNAGMYSGQFRHDDINNNSNSLVRHKEMLSMHGGNVGEKVTDLPSGLY